MKKTTLFTALFLVFSFMGFAQEWHGITSDSPTRMKKTLVSSTEDEIVVDVNIDGFYTNTVMTPNGKQSVIYVDKMASMLETGAPDLPMEPISVIVGDMAEMTVNVVKSSYVDIPNIDVAPSKGNFSRQINPDDVPYTYGEMYQQDAFWPATQAYLESPYIIRDFRGQNIMVRPFAYNPVTKTLRVYTSMTIAMTKVSANGENQKASRRGTVKMSGEQKAEYQRRFINYEESGAKYPFLEDDGEMLVICADQFMESMQPFVEWKNKSGRPTTMVSVTTAGGNNADAIKSYISNYYNDANHDLVYVLFVGDYEHITPHPFTYTGGYSPTTEYSDIWFGMLEGNDYYPEVFVGRFSAQTNAHVTSQVNKVLFYERDMQSDATFGDKGLGIGCVGAGSGHFGEDDYQHIDYIRDTLLHYTYTTVTDLHENGGSGNNATASGISSVINSGVSVINYCNHGSETGWGVANYSCSNVNALTNDNKYPIVFSVACLVGKFNYGGANGECFAESWMRATDNSTGIPTGAIGGMFSWISQPWIPPMYGQDEMVDILTEWRSEDLYNHTMAGVTLNGAMGVLDFGSSKEGAYLGTQHSWLLFGDPSLMVRTDNPVEMSVGVDQQVLLVGMNQLTVTADADYAIATLSFDGETLASGKIINGLCTLSFPPLNNVGTAELVIIGYNKVTYQGTIDVVPATGAFVTVNSSELSAPANNGESVDLSVEFKNVGSVAVNNIAVTISTENEYVNITSAEATIASLAADETAIIDDFQFVVAENVEDGIIAQINVTMTAGDDTWTGKVMVPLHAPVVALSSMTIENQMVTFEIANSGSAPFHGGEMTITSCSPDLTFDPTTITLSDDVAGGETITITSTYTFADGIEEGTCFEVAYDFVTGLFELNDIFNVSYGSIGENFETGQFGDGWTFNPNNAWAIVDGGTKGTKCMKSTNEGLSSTDYSATYTVNIMAAGEITFMYKVSCETGTSTMWDHLKFELDGVEKGKWAGTSMTDFEQFSTPITAGTHQLKWTYHKDGSVNSGQDCAWVDDITIPATSIYTFLTPATNLEAVVDGHDVALTWTASPDAVSYIVKRDGETLGTVAETSYNDYVEVSGTYRYQVLAVNASGSMSVPVTTAVEVMFAGVDDNEVNFGVYPNPAKSVLYINTNASGYEYQILNGVGQVMMSGVANGNAELNVSELNNGVYFLRVIANGSAKIEKIVIK